MRYRHLLLLSVIVLAVLAGYLASVARQDDASRRAQIAMDESLVAEMDPTALPLPATIIPPEAVTSPPATADNIESVPVKIPILVYHSVKPYRIGETLIQRTYQVEPAVFERQMRHLSEGGYDPIVPDDLAAYFQDGQALPPKPVMVTFDDGWENQFEYARPILERYKIRATFYVFPNPIGKDKRFMTWGQLKDLLAAGMAIGCHSKTHPYLTRVADDRMLADQITGAKSRLEQELGVTINSFCYPFGLHDQRVDDEVRRAGFTTARGLRNYVDFKRSDLLNLGGFIITDNFSRFTQILGEGN